MSRGASTELSVEKDFQFWPFQEMFMNHMKNMGWITSLVFTESGTDYNIAKYFGQVRLQTIEKDYQALKISISPLITLKNLNSTASTLGSSTQAANLLNIYLPKKVTIIINPYLWPGSYLPQIFNTASNKEFVVHKK